MIVLPLGAKAAQASGDPAGKLIEINCFINSSQHFPRMELPIFGLIKKKTVSSAGMNSALCKLSLMAIGQSCVVESFTDEAMKQKLLEMGCLPGEVITIDRLAPLGCPMAIELSGSTLSLRLDEADHILVKPLS